jgi:hypothetical protein
VSPYLSNIIAQAEAEVFPEEGALLFLFTLVNQMTHHGKNFLAANKVVV